MNRSLNKLCGVLLLLVAVLIGCDTQPTAAKKRPKVNLSDVMGADQDDLNQGLEHIFRVNDSTPAQVERLGLYHLNQWMLKSEKEPFDWKREPLLSKMPASLAKIQQLEELERIRFTAADFQFLQGRVLSRELTNWATQRAVEEPLASWMKSQSTTLNDEQLKQLSQAWLLFDWVIRNIQLDSIPKREDDAKEGLEILAQQGEDGPGYRHYVRETLFYSHGDALERLRVFIDLCREVGIDVVVIGTHAEKTPFQPWVAGVFIGEQMYLFDCEMGLPIPAANDSGIATLAEITADPALLRQLDLDEKRPYRISNEDLKTLEARLSVAPEELSLRMAKLQAKLVGDRRLQISYQPAETLERLKKFQQLSPVVSFWNVPFLSCLYSDFGRGIRRRKDAEFEIKLVTEMAMVSPGSDPAYARQMHLQGIFEQRDLHPGAVVLYMKTRPSEYTMDEMRLSSKGREKMGLETMLSKNDMIRKKQLELALIGAERMRENVSYWMGLIQYERDDYANAVDWFKERSLAIAPNNFWTRSLRYNLARSYERLGEHAEAIKLYRLDSSAQRHGNMIRARRLQAALDNAK
jgi:tetratricopeptide (TPR) repeat protein